MAEMGYHIRVDFDASFNLQSGDSIQVSGLVNRTQILGSTL